MKKVGIWIRVSTDDQARGESPQSHEHRARMYAEVKQWEILEVYHLEGVSGKAVMHHSEAKRMLLDIKTGKITGLIFSKIARLARNTKELLEISDIFKEYNADLISLNESIDTATPSGRFFFTILSAMGQWEREEISDRVSASAKVRAQLGKHIGGRAPFGFKYVNKELTLDDEEAPIRKLMYDLFLENKRKTTTAEELNKRGYRTRDGKKFGYSTVKRLLEDPIGKGLHRVNYAKSMGQSKKWKLKPKEEWIFRSAPSIISEEKWNRIQAILLDQEKNNNQPLNKKLNIFTNYIFCACGSKMLVKPQSTPKYVCVGCKSKIPCADIERVFQEQLKEYVSSKDEILNYLSATKKSITDKSEQLIILKRTADDLDKKLSHLLDLNMKGELPTDGFKQHYNPIFEQLKQTKNEVAQLEGEMMGLSKLEENSDYVMNEALNLYSKWDSFTQEEKRNIVELIVDKITLDGDNIYIDVNYLIPPTTHPFKEENLPSATMWLQWASSIQKIRLFGTKPKNKKHPNKLITIGNHIKAKRLNNNITIEQTANAIGVSKGAIMSWENNSKKPSIIHYPKIKLFLGYEIHESLDLDLSNRLLNYRKVKGLTQDELAKEIKIDQKRISKIESNSLKISQKLLLKIEQFLETKDYEKQQL